MDPATVLRLLLDPDRLAVIGSIASSPRTVEEAAAHAQVDARTALETIAALRSEDAVRVMADQRYQLDPAALRAVARQLPQPAPPDSRMLQGMTEAEQEVLARFFSGDRLTEIPSSHSKRLVVLERLALEFEPGRRYPEREVNQLLGRFHPDHATLRRALVDEGLLERASGEYWRAGGRVLT